MKTLIKAPCLYQPYNLSFPTLSTPSLVLVGIISEIHYQHLSPWLADCFWLVSNVSRHLRLNEVAHDLSVPHLVFFLFLNLVYKKNSDTKSSNTRPRCSPRDFLIFFVPFTNDLAFDWAKMITSYLQVSLPAISLSLRPPPLHSHLRGQVIWSWHPSSSLLHLKAFSVSLSAWF